MFSKKVEQALNQQIKVEAESSQFYLAMASWAETEGINGTAAFLYKHSDEERVHMMKLVRFVNERGGHAIVPALAQPPVKFDSVQTIFKSLLEHEIAVTQSIEEVVEDGPFYVLNKGDHGTVAWDELPEFDDGTLFDLNAMLATSTDPNGLLYENHGPSAQVAWEELAERQVTHEVTRAESDGRQVHVELGLVDERCYLYCANTFDQRQLVLMEEARAELLETYYREILRGLP